MSSKWSMVDNSFPTVNQGERPSESVQKIVNYMQILVDQLKYLLNNLGKENWNSKELETVQKETTSDVEQEVTNVAGDMEAVRKTAERLQGAVSYLERDQSEQEGRLTDLEREMGEAQADLTTLFGAITVGEDGSVTIGGSGITLKLVGTVTINGKEV